ncbi:MAG: 3-dehydroquinate synthase [Lachnospiraceae bacterium]|nr:3-dehydroquinate synthase [Lachnospiraceae bacterium]
MDINKARDIEATYEKSDTTRFIIDESPDFKRLEELSVSKAERLFVVIDKIVAELYQEQLLKALDCSGKEIYIHAVEATEEAKSIRYYPVLLSFFEEHSVGRYDAVIAVGGGIIIDLVSFTVSTYMRGLPLYVIATTLIGQTDASTAGKTCLNSENSKNLLGTFYYPREVYNNIEILKTCSRRITRQGLSEAFKYSLLTDGKLLDTIIAFQTDSDTAFDSERMLEIVENTIRARIAVRKVDPLASNLGHTFGHALEKYYHYRILHGDAILTGTVMANLYAVRKGLLKQEECDRIFGMMQQAHLNVYIARDLDPAALVELMRKDKKSSANKLHLVELCGVGKPYRGETPLYEADYGDVLDFLKEYMKTYTYQVDDLIEVTDREEL